LLFFVSLCSFVMFIFFRKKSYFFQISNNILIFAVDLYTIFITVNLKNEKFIERFFALYDLLKISTWISFILRINFSYFSLSLFLIYKLIIFLVVYNIKNDLLKGLKSNTFEIFAFIFNCIIVLILNFFRNDMKSKSKENFKQIIYVNEYLKSLINSYNSSFISFNFSKNLFLSNKEFVNFLKKLKFNEEKIYMFEDGNLENKNKDKIIIFKNNNFKEKNINDKNVKEDQSLNYKRYSFIFPKKYFSQNIKNKAVDLTKVNSSDRMILKASSDKSFVNDLNKKYSNFENTIKKSNDVIIENNLYKEDIDNSSIKKDFIYVKENNYENEDNLIAFNNNNNELNNDYKHISNLKKLNFLLDEVFSNFYLEEKSEFKKNEKIKEDSAQKTQLNGIENDLNDKKRMHFFS